MKRLPLLFLFLFGLMTGAAFAADAGGPAPFYVPPAQFNAALQVMDNGFANVTALFRSATGSFTFDPAAKTLSNLRIAIDTTSLMAGNNEIQRDLSNLFAAFQYPEIRIASPDSVIFTDNKAEIKATVTLHGNSKPVAFQATLNRVGKSRRAGGMWSSEGDAVGISMHGDIKRADFGISDNPETPGRFGDTITLTLDMQAIGQ